MNSKTLKIIAIILAVTTVAGIAAFFITRGGGDGGILPDIVKPEEFSFADSKYTTSAMCRPYTVPCRSSAWIPPPNGRYAL